MKFFRVFLVLILGMLIGLNSASATLITSFEGGSTLDDNEITVLTQTTFPRAVIQLLATSSGTTLMPTNSTHLLKMTAGTEVDIINPAFPNQLVTLVTFDNSVHIDKTYFLADFAFMSRDSSPRNDRQWIGLNGVLYDITGSTETGYHVPFTLGWQTLAIHFTNLGKVDLSLGCVNDTFNGSSSYCVWDNFRTADFIPTLAENNGIPIFSSPNIPDNIIAPPPVSAVPEPETWSMVLLGLFLTGLMGRAKNS